jgi:hypothetical protein
MGVCVKINKSQYMRGLGYPAARGIGLGKWKEIGGGKNQGLIGKVKC